MLDCVFHFKYKGEDVYLNGRYGVQPDFILDCYVEWYNNDFRFDIDGTVKPERLKTDFVYIGCFCPIDFYDETRNYQKVLISDWEPGQKEFADNGEPIC